MDRQSDLVIKLCSRCRNLTRFCKCDRRLSRVVNTLYFVLAVTGLVIGTISMCGCSAQEIMYRYDQTTASTALAAMACKDALSDANTEKVTQCGAVLRTDGKAPTQQCLDAWKLRYESIDKACLAVKDGAKTAQRARAVVEASVTKQKDALGWIARLTQLALDVGRLFADAGVRYGGQ